MELELNHIIEKQDQNEMPEEVIDDHIDHVNELSFKHPEKNNHELR
jgi:hypothetical protein